LCLVVLLSGIEQMDSIKLLGIVLQSNLSFSNHAIGVNFIFNLINQRLFQQGLRIMWPIV